jgi:hypothetical protein
LKFSLLVFALVFLNPVYAQPLSGSSQAVREVRLESFKRNYVGKTIRFIDRSSFSVRGRLLDVTKNHIVVSVNEVPVSYEHEYIDQVFVDPSAIDLFMTFGLSALGGIAGYLTLTILKSDPDAAMKGVVPSIGVGLGGILGLKSFYKPLGVDISGRTRA